MNNFIKVYSFSCCNYFGQDFTVSYILTSTLLICDFFDKGTVVFMAAGVIWFERKSVE